MILHWKIYALSGQAPPKNTNPENAFGWLDDPDVAAVFEKVCAELLPESDRGAVLIAADIATQQLDKAFVSRGPKYMKSRIRRMQSYPGIASTLSAKAEIAGLCGWIDEKCLNAIDSLRKIRNEAAHSDGQFSLETQTEQLNNMLALGKGVSNAVHNMAVELLVLNFFHTLRKDGEKLVNVLGENPFGSFEKIVEELEKRPEWSTTLEARIPRIKLGLGLCLIVWLIAQKQEAPDV
ncbi:hypothetical protein [Hyphobacterium sp.]|uniref:hypothetical protein n=1 Tax=Hyphobacterium sp. TaxID=2004662 RepID=UPI00374886EF